LLLLCCSFFEGSVAELQQSRNALLPISLAEYQMITSKPYQSKLVPYEAEIVAWRRSRPPMSYARIANLLHDKHDLQVTRTTVFRFIKVRYRGRKGAYFGHSAERSFERTNLKIAGSTPKPCGSDQTADPWDAIERLKKEAQARSQFRKQPLLKTFTPSNQYNLTLLSPEEAEAFKKKLSQEIDQGE
jgi:hypothetical protein